ncbi:glycerol dehydrogenase [Paracoccus homiensis]|uniref:Glycerol dehydrogenase n=1 Tax=Paracoccus homiensis TaxID=364199 RepID=A0A1I0IKC2_9RHOB|nr:glycerol dehydrogenase [Paracoccus homiensis]SET97219.1 glycerol 2-dehydrogenase (NAD+) [Paracoccus homiensis]
MTLLTAAFPARYVQGPDALGHFGEEAARFGQRILVLADATLPEEIVARLDPTGVEMTVETVEPAATETAISYAVDRAKALGADAIAGLGGGKTLDQARAAADICRLPFISVPSSASSDAPCSALAVIYGEDGEVIEDRFVRTNPALVLVDSSVILSAPARLLAAGIGDALATWFEARACLMSGANNMTGGRQTRLAMQIAETCYDTLIEYGVTALADLKGGFLSPALEAVIEANILMSGLGFESGGVAAAHAIHHGLAELRETHGALHGEKVAFGVLVGLVLNDAPIEEITKVREFLAQTGLPTYLGAVGITDADAAIPVIAKRACRAGEIIHNEPIEITTALVEAALREADLIGRPKELSNA